MAATDLFEDSTMTFGEHIEELRTHLVQALKGIFFALVVTMFMGDTVVRVIILPVESQLRQWVSARMEQRTKDMEAAEVGLPDDQVKRFRLEATLTPEGARSLATGLGLEMADVAAEPIKFSFDASLTKVLRQLSMPMAEISGRVNLKTLSAQEAFMVYFKAAMGAAIVLSSPWVFYQIYSFIAVGLYAHERRFVNLSLPFSVGLFLSGVFVCYFIMFPFMLKFFLGANNWMNLEPDIRLTEWVGFAVLMTIIFGIMFQMPLLMLILERVGILSHDQLAGKRKLSILVIFIVAAVVTPADPTTQVILAIPMCLLFELGLFLMRYFQRRNPFSVESPMPEF